MLAGIAASAGLSALYARGGFGWLLGFVLLVPWLAALEKTHSVRGTLCSAWLMAVAYSAAVMAWFGMAIGSYTQVGAGSGLALLLMAAPLLQPQFLAYGLIRHLVRQLMRHKPPTEDGR